MPLASNTEQSWTTEENKQWAFIGVSTALAIVVGYFTPLIATIFLGFTVVRLLNSNAEWENIAAAKKPPAHNPLHDKYYYLGFALGAILINYFAPALMLPLFIVSGFGLSAFFINQRVKKSQDNLNHALRLSVMQLDHEQIDSYLKRGADPLAPSPDVAQNTTLHLAIQDSHLAAGILRKLLDHIRQPQLTFLDSLSHCAKAEWQALSLSGPREPMGEWGEAYYQFIDHKTLWNLGALFANTGKLFLSVLAIPSQLFANIITTFARKNIFNHAYTEMPVNGSGSTPWEVAQAKDLGRHKDGIKGLLKKPDHIPDENIPATEPELPPANKPVMFSTLLKPATFIYNGFMNKFVRSTPANKM